VGQLTILFPGLVKEPIAILCQRVAIKPTAHLPLEVSSRAVAGDLTAAVEEGGEPSVASHMAARPWGGKQRRWGHFNGGQQVTTEGLFRKHCTKRNSVYWNQVSMLHFSDYYLMTRV